MLDVARLAEQLIADGVPSQTKVADAPVLVVSEGEHRLSAALKKIAHLVRTEGITVQHLDLEDVLSGAAVMKIAADEEAPMGAALSTHPLAIEARKFAAELRKFAADERRAKIASMELELEREIVAHHEKRANDYVARGTGAANPQKTHGTGGGAGPGAMAALGAAGVGAGLAAPHVIDAMRGNYQSNRPGVAITSSDGADVGAGVSPPTSTPHMDAGLPHIPPAIDPHTSAVPVIDPHLSQLNDDAARGMTDIFGHSEMDYGGHPYDLKPTSILADRVKDNEHLVHLLRQFNAGARGMADSAQDYGQRAYDYGSQFAGSIFGGP